MDSKQLVRTTKPTVPETVAAADLAMLNIGCGSHFHGDWVNLDLVSESPFVIAHDVVEGLPFEDRVFDVVYHSHILEHLNPEYGSQLIRECFRTLKPGGVLRVVVPDLERIVELYLETHIRAWEGDIDAQADYNWMKLELLDQMVRDRSGGRMGSYMSNPSIPNQDFVRSRVGDEFELCRRNSNPDSQSRWFSKFVIKSQQIRLSLAQKVIKWLLGSSGDQALAEGLFRASGEVHRWMYDRFSLRDVCERHGFKQFRIMKANQSQISGFSTYQLDVVEGVTRKPDSLYCECRKSDE